MFIIGLRHPVCVAVTIAMAVLTRSLAWADDTPVPRILSDAERLQLQTAVKDARSGKWRNAVRNAVRVGNPLALELIQWRNYRRGGADATFAEIKSFIDAHDDWPDLRALQRAAEEQLPDDLTDSAAITWFTRFPPVTGPAKQRLAEAMIAQGDVAEGTELLRDTWIKSNFTTRDERAFLRAHKGILSAANHEQRLDRLLWDEQRGAARRMLGRVSAKQKQLATARLYLMERSGGVDAAIKRVAPELKSHPGLIYERARWRRRAGKDASARELLRDLPDDLIRPDKWWHELRYQIREALDDGHISEAYGLAAKHGQTSGAGYADAEWMAGWLALRFLNEPVIAERHFVAMYKNVKYPISRARGAYWSGRAAEAAGNTDRSLPWYQLAAQHPTTFYGQLAGQALNLATHFVPESPAIPIAAREVFEARPIVQATRMLGEVEDFDTMRTFVFHLSDTAQNPAEHALVTELGLAYGAPHLSIMAAKRATRSGVQVVHNNYPAPFGATDLSRVANPPEMALLLGLARQESEMNPRAISRAGARGLMQLMPATAKDMARKLGVRYKRSRLTEDPNYNLLLGSSYLAMLLEDYDGAYALALAAYNAGPGRVTRWLRTYGDPRRGEIDPIDWIELIPFYETRNYVQRVLESAQVYRHSLNGASSPRQIRLVTEHGDAHDNRRLR